MEASTINPATNHSLDLKGPLINNETKRMMELYVNVIVFIITSLFGVVGNLVNIVVYRKQGLKDSITLGFFALSVSDLILVAMPLFTGSLYAAKYVFRDSPVDFSSIHYVSFGWIRNFMYSSSCLITAFLSLERCCCVVLPFKVQTIFTRTKTAVFLSTVIVFHAGCMLLLPAAVQLRWQKTPPSQNSSEKLRVWFSGDGHKIELFYSTVISFVVPVCTQVIVTVCAFFMVRGLHKSSQFRAEATGKLRTKPDLGNAKDGMPLSVDKDNQTLESSTEVAGTNSSLKHSIQPTLSQRDARLVKTMVFLVTILSLCNVPFLVATFAWRTIPDLDIGRRYNNMLSVIFSIVYVLGNINASSNVIVYYKTSSRFKAVARETFCGGREK